MNRDKTSLFLIELIITIGFFAIASAICMQIFATAHNMSLRSIGIQRAVVNTNSAASAFIATEGDLEQVAYVLGGHLHGNFILVDFNEDWNMTQDLSELRYQLSIIQSSVYPLVSAEILVKDILFDEEIHSITVKRYIGVR